MHTKKKRGWGGRGWKSASIISCVTLAIIASVFNVKSVACSTKVMKTRKESR